MLIRTLVNAGGSATLRQLAHAYLSGDEDQLRHYERRIRDMPVRVLANRGVVERHGDLVELTAARLTLEQKAQLRLACERRLQEFVRDRGEDVWDLIEHPSVPTGTRYAVMEAANHRCQLCGARDTYEPLQVDHIIPASRGGPNELANFQALCGPCNRSKSNRDDRDFHNRPPERVNGCVFCSDSCRTNAIEANGDVVAIRDAHPVTEGHVLVLPLRHCQGWFAMTEDERTRADELIRVLGPRMRHDDPSITGFNIGTNAGESAGQTIDHAHLHLIPRRLGDVQNASGGVRGVIPSRQSY